MTTQSKTHACEALESLKWRYATKQFDPSKKISQDLWGQLEDALRLSPSSYGLQPYRFVVVTDPKIKKELVAAAWNQTQVADCSHWVVFARLKEVNIKNVEDFVQLISKTRNVPVESLQAVHGMISGFIGKSSQEELAQWTARQCYIALGNLMTVASILRIDNCPMEGIKRDEVDRILQLPEKGCHSVVACALGYRAEDDKYASLAKVRFPSSELFIRV